MPRHVFVRKRVGAVGLLALECAMILVRGTGSELLGMQLVLGSNDFPLAAPVLAITSRHLADERFAEAQKHQRFRLPQAKTRGFRSRQRRHCQKRHVSGEIRAKRRQGGKIAITLPGSVPETHGLQRLCLRVLTLTVKGSGPGYAFPGGGSGTLTTSPALKTRMPSSSGLS